MLKQLSALVPFCTAPIITNLHLLFAQRSLTHTHNPLSSYTLQITKGRFFFPPKWALAVFLKGSAQMSMNLLNPLKKKKPGGSQQRCVKCEWETCFDWLRGQPWACSTAAVWGIAALWFFWFGWWRDYLQSPTTAQELETHARTGKHGDFTCLWNVKAKNGNYMQTKYKTE